MPNHVAAGRNTTRGWVLAGTVLLMATSAGAQTVPPPLTSNRPGIAESEALVGRGVLQIEGGMQAADAPPGDDRSWTQTWGQLNIRVGVRPRIEIFAGWDGLSLDRVQSTASHGSSPAATISVSGRSWRS